MKVIAINGSPRKGWNTAQLLSSALEGAASVGADTTLIHLYDLNFKGCTSCLACKIIDGKFAGRCAMQDDLTPLLSEIEQEADILLLGSPIYFGGMTGESRSFMERLLFAPMIYTKPPSSTFPRKIKTGLIYTMNVTEQGSHDRNYPVLYQTTEGYFARILGHAETLCVYDTCQFPDFSKVIMDYADPEYKIDRKQNVLPKECQKAFSFGKQLASE